MILPADGLSVDQPFINLRMVTPGQHQPQLPLIERNIVNKFNVPSCETAMIEFKII